MAGQNDARAAVTRIQHVKAAPQLNVDETAKEYGTLQKRWSLWKEMSDNCCIVTRLDTQEDRYQVSLFLVTIGQDALEIQNIFEYAIGEDKNKLRTLTNKCGAYLIGELNVTHERYVFNQRCQNAGESFECY